MAFDPNALSGLLVSRFGLSAFDAQQLAQRLAGMPGAGLLNGISSNPSTIAPSKASWRPTAPRPQPAPNVLNGLLYSVPPASVPAQPSTPIPSSLNTSLNKPSATTPSSAPVPAAPDYSNAPKPFMEKDWTGRYIAPSEAEWFNRTYGQASEPKQLSYDEAMSQLRNTPDISKLGTQDANRLLQGLGSLSSQPGFNPDKDPRTQSMNDWLKATYGSPTAVYGAIANGMGGNDSNVWSGVSNDWLNRWQNAGMDTPFGQGIKSLQGTQAVYQGSPQEQLQFNLAQQDQREALKKEIMDRLSGYGLKAGGLPMSNSGGLVGG